MDTRRPHSRGRSQPSVRWANSRSPSRSPSRGFQPDGLRADPAFVQVSPRDATPSRSRSRPRSLGSRGSRSLSRSRSRGPSTDRYGNPLPADPDESARPRSRRSSASWVDKAPKFRDENGKLVKSSLAILGAIGAAAYVAHRTLPKVIPGSHDDGGDDNKNRHQQRSSSGDKHGRRDDGHRRRHGERVERHHRYASFYEEDGPPSRPREDYHYPDERRQLPSSVRTDRAEPAWSRESNVTTTKYIEQAPRPASRGVAGVQPGLYTGNDDKVLYIDGEGRRYVEEYRSDRFWPGGRLP
ncbi:uncharacterized protein B0I36DRAFT_312985 [Microdochium trichocladiopsis]|uniref:Uncharacterized protein n=1 Tax=Microdochium trichocladiopsis TaxID=1682393 RepID=A0A9P8YGZ8_9PEZI|nr:uncharacterized protein B0I36DRAFT_312985 [Microdochium trichocladiopsis]KAH7041537.1 hypothetical protein B0I36DRAFT_312985 [Microdochium trichocladiopsis]